MKQKKPPIPEKIELLSLGEPNYTRQQGLSYIQDRIRALKKVLRKKGSDQRIGMSEPMIRRRTDALLDSMPYIEKRYGALPGLHPSIFNTLGKAWVSSVLPNAFGYRPTPCPIRSITASWIPPARSINPCGTLPMPAR